MFEEYDEYESLVTVNAAMEYFMNNPLVTGFGEIEIPNAHGDQVGAMMVELADNWSGFEGAVAGMYMLCQAAEDRLRMMMDDMDDDCEECAADVNAIGKFLTVLFQFPRAVVAYTASGLSERESADARKLFDSLGLVAPESEEE